MIASPGPLVRQRLGCLRPVGLGELLGIETFRLRTEARREVRRLDKRPRQVLVAVLGIAFAFLLAVTQAHTVATVRIGGEISHLGKATDAADLEQDDDGQHLADTGNTVQ